MSNFNMFLSEFIDFMQNEHNFDLDQMFELSFDDLKPYYDEFINKKLANV